MRSIRGVTSKVVGLAAALVLAEPPAAQEPHDHDHGVAHDPSQRHLAHAEDHAGFPAYVDIFFTHHAYLERKLHPRFETTLAEEEREYEGSGELVWQFGARLGAEIEAVFLGIDPETGEGASGLGDLEIGPMIELVQDAARLFILTVRSGFVLPTGDEDEGLGIEGWGWEPGLLVWKGFGADKRGAIQGEIAYDRVFIDEGEDEEELVYNIGLSYWLPSNWIPIVELNGVTSIESEDTLIAAAGGFRYAFANGQQWGAAIQLPLTDSEAYDVRFVVGGIIHVE